ncbi:hypothetical protein [Candidatus Mycosynbacter amalyticus]|nr:hypothetical protein [Candidatus Mycosynbacter amalyticus]
MSDLFRVSSALTGAWLFGVFLTIILHSLVERDFNEKNAATDESETKKALTDRKRKHLARRSKKANAILRRHCDCFSIYNPSHVFVRGC